MTDRDPYLRLVNAITSGEFAPDQRLVEADLVALTRVSRAAVRTALLRLEQEGLVVREPNRGARVRRVSLDEAFEIVEARAALESLAARHAARRCTDEDIAAFRAILAEMTRCHAEGDLLAYSEGNARLHARILAASRHGTAQRLVAGLKAQVVRYQFRSIYVPGRADVSMIEHHRLVDALASRDEDAAADAMREHLEHVADALRRTAAAQAQLDPVPVPLEERR